MEPPQTPPPSNYHRPDMPVGGPHPADKGIGIAVMVYNLCCGVGSGLIMVTGGALLGALGAGAAASSGGSGATPDAAAVGALGGAVALIGVVFIVVSVAGIASGFGIMNSKRWGFTLCLVLSVISTIIGLISLFGGSVQSIISVAVSGLLAYYCWARLGGKIGSPPAA